MTSTKMTPAERRATISLSFIMGLRMIGLFMVLPVFALYANGLEGSTPMLIGVSMGIYGLFQAIFQITFGSLSDRIGRKPAILIALIIFAIGSLLAGSAQTIQTMIFGRALQGIGAIGSTTLALLADLTREDQRTKAMMVSGICIGFSFTLAMLTGPLLAPWLTVGEMFDIAAVMAALAAIVLFTYVPNPTKSVWHGDTEPEAKSFLQLLFVPELGRLNLGIFTSHAVFTASFIAIPMALHQFIGLAASEQWKIYLPALAAALVLSVIAIGLAERRKQVKKFFLIGILTMAISLGILWLGMSSSTSSIVGIALFFAGFSLLESFLPSLVSRTAPAASKGSAMGIYSCSQYSGIFAGGVLGGWLFSHFQFSGVYSFCIGLTLLWFFIALPMREPQRQKPDFIRSREHLQSINS